MDRGTVVFFRNLLATTTHQPLKSGGGPVGNGAYDDTSPKFSTGYYRIPDLLIPMIGSIIGILIIIRYYMLKNRETTEKFVKLIFLIAMVDYCYVYFFMSFFRLHAFLVPVCDLSKSVSILALCKNYKLVSNVPHGFHIFMVFVMIFSSYRRLVLTYEKKNPLGPKLNICCKVLVGINLLAMLFFITIVITVLDRGQENLGYSFVLWGSMLIQIGLYVTWSQKLKQTAIAHVENGKDDEESEKYFLSALRFTTLFGFSFISIVVAGLVRWYGNMVFTKVISCTGSCHFDYSYYDLLISVVILYMGFEFTTTEFQRFCSLCKVCCYSCIIPKSTRTGLSGMKAISDEFRELTAASNMLGPAMGPSDPKAKEVASTTK